MIICIKYLFRMFLEEKQGNGWIINYINEFLKIRGYNVKNGGNK